MEFFAGIWTTEEDASVVPTGKRETAKAQQDFAGWGDGVNGNGPRGQGNYGIKRGARLIEERLRFAMGNQPGILISGAARIDLFESLANGVALVEFDGEIRTQSGGAVGQMPGAASRQNKAKRVNRATAIRVARTVQPEQGKGEAAFHGIRGLPVGNGKDREVRRTSAEKPTDIAAGNGILEIGRGGQRLNRFIGKLLREETAKIIAKCFSRKVSLDPLKLQANKFETVG